MNRSFLFGVLLGAGGLWAWHQFKPMGSKAIAGGS